MRKLLWIGDAGCQSGFAKATHYTLETLRKTWDVEVIALNYRGDPPIDPKKAKLPYPANLYPYPMYPAGVSGDLFGVNRLAELIPRIGPEVVVIQNDPWQFPRYAQKLASNWPIIGAIAVDGKNCQARHLNGLTLAIFWTEFALKEARQGGYAGPAVVVPLGVDLEIFKSIDQLTARKQLGMPAKLQNAFIVGNVNRNQLRKRLDLTIAYFAEWVRRYNPDDAFLFLHVAPTGDQGYDCQQLAAYYGVQNRLIMVEPEVFNGVDESYMPATYSSFDVQLTTTQGEGWGLCTMEGMACGIPQIVPDWSALGEWCEDAAYKVDCTAAAVTVGNINVVGGVADREQTVNALEALYRDVKLRKELGDKGKALVRRPEYRWEDIGQKFGEAIDESLALALVLNKQPKRELVDAVSH